MKVCCRQSYEIELEVCCIKVFNSVITVLVVECGISQGTDSLLFLLPGQADTTGLWEYSVHIQIPY